MKIKVENYLNDYEITEIVKDEIRSLVRDRLKKEADVRRIISNAGYHIVFELVNQTIDEDLTEMLRKKVVEEIDKISPFHIITKKDAWEKEDSVAWEIMQDEMRKSRPLIKKRVEEIIENYNFPELYEDDISHTIGEVIFERLFGC